jgi:FMN phosphatase YigB (HAD superfamily)
MKHYLIDMDDTLYLHRGKLDYDSVNEDRRLTYLCKQCPHPKYIYTNATFGHADILLQRMNLSDHFEKIYSRDDKIKSLNDNSFIYSMKPDINSALSVELSIKHKYKNEKNTFYFFDDLLENLYTGKNRKWITVWISPLFYERHKYPFVDYAYPNMKLALEYLNKSNS